MDFHRFVVPWIVLSLAAPCVAQDEPEKKQAPAEKPAPDPLWTPKVKEWLEDTESKVKERSEQALVAGPAALEKLATELQTTGLCDKDGIYTTPFFFQAITRDGGQINGERRVIYQSRTISEWRKRFPESKAARLAEAKFYTAYAWAGRDYGIGIGDMDRKWESIHERYDLSRKLLEECAVLQGTDPAWACAMFALMRDAEAPREDFEKVADRLFVDFPECGYAIHLAMDYLSPRHMGQPGEWERWLRGKLEKLPQPTADRAYCRGICSAATIFGFGTGTWDLFREVEFDKERLARGLDLLAAEYPDSARVACAEAAVAFFILKDKQRDLKALRRAGGVIDMAIMRDIQYYRQVRDFIKAKPAKSPEEEGFPKVVSRVVGGLPESFRKRMEEASAKGPVAVEDLIRKLRSDEILDADGNYQSLQFFTWFGTSVKKPSDESARVAKEKLLADWMKEFPDSPFARLAAAKYWTSYAWDARGSQRGSSVGANQWQGFGNRLKIAREHLMACREIQESEPGWSSVAFTIMMGESAPRKEFDEVAEIFFANFPECDEGVNAALLSLEPKWGGEHGEWEPWVRGKLEGLPDDVRARAYARMIIGRCGAGYYGKENTEEYFGNTKVDRELVRKGIELLHQKLPGSVWVANGDAIVSGWMFEDYDAAFTALRKMEGRLDMTIWYRDWMYETLVDQIRKNRLK